MAFNMPQRTIVNPEWGSNSDYVIGYIADAGRKRRVRDRSDTARMSDSTAINLDWPFCMAQIKSDYVPGTWKRYRFE